MPRLLVSVPWTSPFVDQAISADFEGTVLPRSCDLKSSRWSKMLKALVNAVRVVQASRRHDATVMCTSMIDAVLVSILMLVRPTHPLIVWDFLLPSKPWVRRLVSVPLRRINLWLVIRRGDALTFEAKLGAKSTAFVPFPVLPRRHKPSADRGSYIYAAGIAHRDWVTLLSAMPKVKSKVIISTNSSIHVPKSLVDRVEVLPILSPEEGRQLLTGARVVCVPLKETDLPSGPLLVLDAMQAGKAQVVTDVNGSRDYVTDGADALVVPPADSDRLAQALNRLIADEALNAKLGAAGRRRAKTLTVDHVLAGISYEVEQLLVRAHT